MKYLLRFLSTRPPRLFFVAPRAFVRSRSSHAKAQQPRLFVCVGMYPTTRGCLLWGCRTRQHESAIGVDSRYNFLRVYACMHATCMYGRMYVPRTVAHPRKDPGRWSRRAVTLHACRGTGRSGAESGDRFESQPHNEQHKRHEKVLFVSRVAPHISRTVRASFLFYIILCSYTRRHIFCRPTELPIKSRIDNSIEKRVCLVRILGGVDGSSNRRCVCTCMYQSIAKLSEIFGGFIRN